MTKLSARDSTFRRSSGERVFADDVGRLWCAAEEESAVVFTCICDGRQQGRAIATDLLTLDDDVAESTLRAWLSAAPRIGRLT